MHKIPSRATVLGLAAALSGLPVAPASAHPHVWVTMKSEVVYQPDGTVKGVRHAWTFDDMFSAFAIQGLDTTPEPASAPTPSQPAAKAPEPKPEGFFARLRSWWNRMFGSSPPAAGSGTQTAGAATAAAPTATRGPTREQLQPLAKTNIESLKDFDYFTVANVDGKRVDFVDPPMEEAYLEYKDEVLTLHFLLPFKTPVKAQTLAFEVYDPSYFVDFSFAQKNPVGMTAAPAGCELMTLGPEQMDAAMQQKLFQMSPDQKLDPADQLGAQFANRIIVKCR